ncbi:MAG: hypothetical protein ACUVYA_05545 [Planctomycetota bacterium]
MDISGWSLADGVFFVFPEGTIIQGRKHLVVAADPAALQAATGFGGALGPFAGRLENSGERLELRNNSYRLMDSIRYRDEGDWPVGPDGSGHTLAKIRPDCASGPAAHWTWSREIGGTPGKENFPAGAPSEAPAVALNEIAPASGGASWLEVANWGDAALDLGGFAIEKLGSSPGSFAFASGTLAAGGRRAVPASELGFDFALGDRLFLWAPGRTALLDAVEVKTGPRARHPDGTGRWLVPSAPTPGAANAVSLVETVVVNEILYRPRSIPETPPVTEDQVLVPIDATWKYDGSGADRGTAWRVPTFDDGSWPSGRRRSTSGRGSSSRATPPASSSGSGTWSTTARSSG